MSSPVKHQSTPYSRGAPACSHTTTMSQSKSATHAGLWMYMLVQMFLLISSAAKVLGLGEQPGNIAYAAAGVIALPAIFYLFTLIAYIVAYWAPGERCSNRLKWDVNTFFVMGFLQLVVAAFTTTGFFVDADSVRKDAAVQSSTLTTSITMYMLSIGMIYSLPLKAYPLAAFRMRTAAAPEDRYQRVM